MKKRSQEVRGLPKNPFDTAKAEIRQAAGMIDSSLRRSDPLENVDAIAEKLERGLNQVVETLDGEERARLKDVIFLYYESTNSVRDLQSLRPQHGEEWVRRAFSFAQVELDTLGRNIHAFQKGGELLPLSKEARKLRIERFKKSARRAWEKFSYRTKDVEDLTSFDNILKEATGDSVVGERVKEVIQEYKEDPRFPQDFLDRLKADPQSIRQKEFYQLDDFFREVLDKIFGNLE